MTVVTFNPNDGGDGNTIENDNSFSTAHSAASASGGADNTTILSSVRHRSSGTTYEIKRAHFPFDTSSIPDTAFIVSATLQLYVTSTQNGEGSASWDVIPSTQASLTALAAADYGRVTFSSLGSLAVGSISTNAYNSWTISNPNTNISKTGNTMLALTEHYDTTNSTPPASNAVNEIIIEDTGGAHPPILSVTYQIPMGFFALL